MRMLRLNWGSIGAIGDAVATAISRLTYYWPVSWRGLAALVLGVLLAKWFWVLLAPDIIYTAATPERAPATKAGQLFGIVQVTETSTQGVALPNVVLLGVFAANSGRRGFAILKLDETRQVGVVEGDEVAVGTKLLSVHADHVLLERLGVQQRVNLENKYANSPNKIVQPGSVAAGVSPKTGGIPSEDTVNSYVKDVVEKSLQSRLRQQNN